MRVRLLAVSASACLIASGLASAPVAKNATGAAGTGTIEEPSGSASAVAARFRLFLDGLWPDARMAGVSRPVFAAALDKLTAPDPRVIALTRRQSEFSRPISGYVEATASSDRVARGRTLASTWTEVLSSVEARTGVPASVILAVWAAESGFGTSSGDFDVVRSLATLAFGDERPQVFRTELIQALVILDTEGLGRAALTGSWAGAMGQAQFLPSSFLAHAVDQDGDGRRDIWDSVPDVLGSIGQFLADAGWRAGLSWGYEVTLPTGLDLAHHRRSLSDWARAGVVRSDGRAMPDAGEASLYFPAGIAGPAFLLGDNFEAIRAYNTSDSYALGIGVLADRIAGGGTLGRIWPKEAVLAGPERREVHARLAALGLYQGSQDGKFGARTREAVRRFQAGRGLVADGYVDASLLGALRKPGLGTGIR